MSNDPGAAAQPPNIAGGKVGSPAHQPSPPVPGGGGGPPPPPPPGGGPPPPGQPPGGGGTGTPAPDPGAGGDSHRGPGGGRDYTDVASQVGGGQLVEQNHEHNRAMADFNRVDGDVMIGGTKFELSFGQGDAKIRVSRITAEEKAEPFVRTDAVTSFGAAVKDQCIIVLQGPRGYGKSAAMVRAMLRGLGDDAEMFYLDPATDLAAFSRLQIPEDSVLILKDLPRAAANRIDTDTLASIQSELRSRRSRLGITTERAGILTTSSAGILVVDLLTRPSPRQVFDRHLSILLRGHDVTKDTVLGWPGVSTLLDVQLDQDCSLADAARLATLLARARDEPDTAAARVRGQMTEYADEKVAQWFQRLGSLKAQCMAISLAVLNGLSRETVAREARVLENRILPAPDAANAPPVTNPFGPDATVSPSLLQARVETENRMTAHGMIVVQAMSYTERGYPGRVLRHVWREHDDGRAALVDWLRNLGGSTDLAVRVRAATAVGVLACEAMDYLHSQVILSWACHDDEVIRTSAAIALGPPAGDPMLRDTIRSLVADWARESSAGPLRATAARTYGGSIGLTSPTLALRELARLAAIDDLGLMIAIGNSYCELVLDGTAPLSGRVIGEIEKLAAERAREKQIVGRLALLGLSQLRGAPSALNDQGSRFRQWPSLLALCLVSAKMVASVARLWQLSLNDPDVGGLVTESLDDWAQAAEDVGELRQAFLALIIEVARDDRARRAVLRRARLWTGRDGKAPKTGQFVIEDLG
jgi:hypothetical protein